MVWIVWLYIRAESGGSSGSVRNRVSRKMLEIVKISKETDEEEVVKCPAIRRSEFC